MIEVSRSEGDIWIIRLNRPERANALTRRMLRDIDIAAKDIAKTDAAAVIITGEGPVFSAGADLEEAYSGLATDDVWEDASASVAALPCLSICAINGTLAGGAFGMALACDVRICVPKAAFFYPVMKLGFLPQPSDPVRMKALIGPARTKMVLLAGQRVTAPQALQWGLVDRIEEPEDLTAIAHQMCKDASNALPDIRRDIKKMCR